METTGQSTCSHLIAAAALALVATLLAAPTVQAVGNEWPGTKAGEPTPEVKGVPAELAKNLANFDDLDFRVYTGQQWQDLHKSHSKDVLVHWPDGHTTKGIDKHIEDLKVMFTFAPDNRIKEHPVRFGTSDGEWTAVTGWLEGTFTKPMALPDGKSIQPTGKACRSPTSRWNSESCMCLQSTRGTVTDWLAFSPPERSASQFLVVDEALLR